MASLSISEWTSIVSTTAAAVAAAFSAISIAINRRTSREQRASDSFKKYHELALQHPTLSTLKKEELHDWFVSFVLMMVFDVLKAHKGNRLWEQQMERQLSFWVDELRGWTKEEILSFGPDVANLVDKVTTKSVRS
jgi:hypothetical protein